MPHLHTSQAATGTGDRSRPRAALPALCATQITSWGIVYYAFPVLNARITADTGWSTTATTGAFSGALVVSALAGIPVGRILDRRGPRAVMTVGSLLGVAAVLGIAYAPNLAVFTAAWLVAGVAMAATFYQPAFAALTLPQCLKGLGGPPGGERTGSVPSRSSRSRAAWRPLPSPHSRPRSPNTSAGAPPTRPWP